MECRRGPAYAAGRRPQAAARRQREPVQALANAPVKAMPAPLRRPKAVRPAALARGPSRRASRLAFQRNRFTPGFATGHGGFAVLSTPPSVHGPILPGRRLV